jgi:glycosyltransferase involved in cell wall biosynthesis
MRPVQPERLTRAVIYTTEEERTRARQSFWLYRAHEQVVPYGTSVPPLEAAPLREAFLQAVPGLRGKRIVLFLGRVHVKKGCDLLIDAFARVASRDPSLHLMIAGPDETGWVASLRAQAQAAGIAHRISLPGMLQGDLKWGAFHASDVFILPSHQENFGVAVAEALGCGLPALISDKVNVWREIEADGAGMVAARVRKRISCAGSNSTTPRAPPCALRRPALSKRASGSKPWSARWPLCSKRRAALAKRVRTRSPRCAKPLNRAGDRAPPGAHGHRSPAVPHCSFINGVKVEAAIGSVPA